MKRVYSILFSLLITLALGTPAFAAGDGNMDGGVGSVSYA